MKLKTALARCLLRLFGISAEELDIILKDAMSFVCTPIMLGLALDKATWAIANTRVEVLDLEAYDVRNTAGQVANITYSSIITDKGN